MGRKGEGEGIFISEGQRTVSGEKGEVAYKQQAVSKDKRGNKPCVRMRCLILMGKVSLGSQM